MTGLTATVDGAETGLREVVEPRQAPPQAGLVSADRTSVRIAAQIAGDDAAVDRSSLCPDVPRRRAVRPPGAAHPCARPRAGQPGHHGTRQRRSRLVATPDDPAHVPDPADRVRRGRSPHSCRWSWRSQRCSPRSGSWGCTAKRRPGQRLREPAGRADRARGGGRLLAVHGHPLPHGTAGAPGEARRDPSRLGDRRAGRCSSPGLR